MTTLVERAENFLAHYASEYYDPVKAREYYLRTRELKGRQSTSGMSDTQKEGWAYAKDQIATRQKADLQTAAERQKAQLEQLRATVQAQREQISAAITSALQSISDKRKAELENVSALQAKDLENLAADHQAKSYAIREAAAQKIAALPPVPRGVSDERRAELAARRAEQIAKINGDAWNDLVSLAGDTAKSRDTIVSSAESKRQSVVDSATAQKEQTREAGTAARQALSDGMRSAVDKARSDYESRKESIKAEYEAAAQREYEGLRANLPGAPDKEKKGSSKSKKDDAKTTKKPGVKSISLEEGARQALERYRNKP